MGAFAVVTLPIDLTRRSAAASIAQHAVETFPGTRNVALDEGAGTVSFELHFPGNISGLIRRLSDRLIPVGESAQVSLPVTSLAPELLAGGPAVVGERVVAGSEVWDVAFDRGRWVLNARLDGDRLEASIVPSTNSMHQIYDALLSLGLVAREPQPATRGL